MNNYIEIIPNLTIDHMPCEICSVEHRKFFTLFDSKGPKIGTKKTNICYKCLNKIKAFEFGIYKND